MPTDLYLYSPTCCSEDIINSIKSTRLSMHGKAANITSFCVMSSGLALLCSAGGELEGQTP